MSSQPTLTEILNNLPSSWDDCTIEEYALVEAAINEEYSSIMAKNLDIISIFSGYDAEFFDDFYASELIPLYEKIQFVFEKPDSKVYQQEIGEYSVVKFDKLSWGELIDLEKWDKNRMNNYHLMLAVLYRKENEKYDDVDVFKRAEEFKELTSTDVFGVFFAWGKHYKNNIVDLYQVIYENNSEEIDYEGLSSAEIADIKAEIEEEKKMADFVWYKYLHYLSAGRVIDELELLKMPYVYIFNTITAKKNLNLFNTMF